MNKKNQNHLGYYISLIAIIIMSAVLVILNMGNKELQIIIFILTTIFYIIWGILHHLLNHELSSKIIIEYILIGAVGISIIFFVFMGGRSI
ncbi:MAG: hypothetical protein CO135_02975 [Candidatus Levybacteria bacterium CG_4_9_14_3_um_filter_35_16]|nr:MAG: hypothetical protein COW87_01660 [Candidatus Levybacteria bacterium CG22_combo_CG10-13_8_21_14_all_35_11]PIY94167.1 MAG: hypothetical protein COY68_04060 [Candidatus Levybacteria bacterium CG_4_10_14_0_8_um_filter_35_23]PJA91113.1 MAG: hypothetical protein CO135_02975 [Candidatus Levybacteria bacterium CG_4_9_14_3_um_filter_35_16]PJC54400.1 MAG: hypothetical protein CO028_02635 [Candidatus Levybacteria bacterium CG_4_9_14_0_2_um_filter_35_21]